MSWFASVPATLRPGRTRCPARSSSLPQLPDSGEVLLNLLAMAIYLILGLLLMGQMLMRLALVDALLVIAPLALLGADALPASNGYENGAEIETGPALDTDLVDVPEPV